jgi:AbrB family looped-hinge helix DNA binding protein
MNYLVSITSQGQISIPAPIRKKLGLNKKGKAYVSLENGKAVIESVPDFMELAGSLSKYAIKNKSIDEIIRLEHKAVEEAVIERYKRKLKREGNKLLFIKP